MMPQLLGVDEFTLLGSLLVEQWDGVFLVSPDVARQTMLEASLITPAVMQERIAAHKAATEAQKTVRVDASSVAHVYLSGVISKHGSSMSSAGSSVLATQAIRKAGQNPDVKGILFHIDSPGGAWTGTSELNQEVAKWAAVKPIVVAGEGIVASGGYLAATSATEIWLPKWDVAGSLGVYTTVPDMSRAYENAGVKVHLVKYGQSKGAGVPGVAISEETLADVQQRVNEIAVMFQEQVSAGRRVDMQTVERWFTGKTYSAAQSLEMGLIDHVGGPDEALASLIDRINGKVSVSVPGRVQTMETRSAASELTQVADDPEPQTETSPMTKNDMIAVCSGYDPNNANHKAFILDQMDITDNSAVKVATAWGEFRVQEANAKLKQVNDQLAASQTALTELQTRVETPSPRKPGGAAPLAGGEAKGAAGAVGPEQMVQQYIADMNEFCKENAAMPRQQAAIAFAKQDPERTAEVHKLNRKLCQASLAD